jgi:hypothetical protein
MCSASESLPEIVRERADVGSGRDFGDESGTVTDDALDLEATDFHFHGFEFDRFIPAGEFVGGDTVHLLSGVRRRDLQDVSGEGGQMLLDLGESRRGALDGANGLSLGVVRVCGKPETHFSFIHFGGIVKKLREAREAANHEGQDPGGHWVEGSKVADAALSDDSANAIDDVVRGEVGGFVEDKDCVNHSVPWSRKAGWRSTRFVQNLKKCRMM